MSIFFFHLSLESAIVTPVSILADGLSKTSNILLHLCEQFFFVNRCVFKVGIMPDEINNLSASQYLPFEEKVAEYDRQIAELKQSNLQDGLENSGEIRRIQILRTAELKQVYSNLKIDVPTPDLVIYLQASPDVLMSRVRKRGVKYEADIHPDYLRKLSDAYTAYFHRYVESPLLIVNASEMNFVEREEHYLALVEQIAITRSGRHFFNPLVEAL